MARMSEREPACVAKVVEGEGERLTAEVFAQLAERWAAKQGREAAVVMEGETGAMVALDSEGVPVVGLRAVEKWLPAEVRPTVEMVEPFRLVAADGRPALKEWLENPAVLKEMLTLGIEVEGLTMAEQDGRLVAVEGNDPQRPEVCAQTLELATPEPTADLLKLASELGRVVVDFGQFTKGSLYLLTSVPETGRIEELEENPHPYVQLYLYRYIKPLIEEKGVHPRAAAVLEMLGEGASAKEVFREWGFSVWPCHALHTKVGIPPLREGAAVFDGQLVVEMRNRLNSVGWKVVSFLTVNSIAFLGRELEGLVDGRMALRRFFPTTWGNRAIPAFPQAIEEAVAQFLQGEIHSFSRYPWDGQHGMVRWRPKLGAIENTETHQHPHLGVCLAVQAAQRLFALWAVEDYVLGQRGADFLRVPLGLAEELEMERAFEEDRWEGKVRVGETEWSLRQLAKALIEEFDRLAERYPPFAEEAAVASFFLSRALEEPAASLEDYFNPESEGYARGVLSDIKRSGLSLDEMCRLQHQGTQQLAKTLMSNPRPVLGLAS